jgi:hypothetical protein
MTDIYLKSRRVCAGPFSFRHTTPLLPFSSSLFSYSLLCLLPKTFSTLLPIPPHMLFPSFLPSITIALMFNEGIVCRNSFNYIDLRLCKCVSRHYSHENEHNDVACLSSSFSTISSKFCSFDSCVVALSKKFLERIAPTLINLICLK